MIRWCKVVVFVVCLLPLARLGWKGCNGLLGASPIPVLTRSTGIWALVLLLITLALTPVRKFTGQLWLIRFRRMVGLFSFFYVVLHFLTYTWLDNAFDFHEMLVDSNKRPSLVVGLAGFMLLIPLAATSTSGSIRRLGGRRWGLLHRLIYISAIAGVIHYWWLVKADSRKPVEYAFVLGLLLFYRVVLTPLLKTQTANSRVFTPARAAELS